jgi:hypothetical protein
LEVNMYRIGEDIDPGVDPESLVGRLVTTLPRGGHALRVEGHVGGAVIEISRIVGKWGGGVFTPRETLYRQNWDLNHPPWLAHLEKACPLGGKHV